MREVTVPCGFFRNVLVNHVYSTSSSYSDLTAFDAFSLLAHQYFSVRSPMCALFRKVRPDWYGFVQQDNEARGNQLKHGPLLALHLHFRTAAGGE
jgi:hypothetical protein